MIQVTSGNVPMALAIIREAAAWLIERGRPLWRLEDLTEENILAGILPEQVHVGWVNDEPAAAMILQWQDALFWPQAGPDSAFIHKLSVRRSFAGQCIAFQMLDWARQQAIRQGKTYLRLDCAADRPILCSFYEKYGFHQVARRMVGPFDCAFYELPLESRG
jgi:GNAT superfamily N-acetyltransferase